LSISDTLDPDPETGPASAAAQSPTEAVDRHVHELLLKCYHEGGADVFAAEDPAEAELDKKAAARLVQLRLAFYPDESRDRIQVTNSGRYWALNGGYMAFLKEDPPTGGGGRGRNPEMEALRFNYMNLRLKTFWLSLGMSIAGFVISLISIGIAFYYGGRIPF
jgi:hypothetical protein